MPTLNYSLPYSINSNLVLSAQELDSIYLFGIDFRDDNGNRYPDSAKEYHILNAQEALEDYLSIKIFPQIISEEFDFNMRDFANWGYLRTSFPVNEAISLKGFIGNTRQVTYPASWISTRSSNDPNNGYYRQIRIVPGGGDGVDFSSQAIFSGTYPFIGYGNNNIPNYFNVTYCTGFNIIPRDILNAVGKLAAIDILNPLGDLGALGAGLASQSLSIDGLSQSASSTASATSGALTARVIQYTKEMDKELKNMRDRYVGIMFSSL